MLTRKEFIESHKNCETIHVETTAKVTANDYCVYGGFYWTYYPNRTCIEVSKMLNCYEDHGDYNILDSFSIDLDVNAAYDVYVNLSIEAEDFDKQNIR